MTAAFTGKQSKALFQPPTDKDNKQNQNDYITEVWTNLLFKTSYMFTDTVRSSAV